MKRHRMVILMITSRKNVAENGSECSFCRKTTAEPMRSAVVWEGKMAARRVIKLPLGKFSMLLARAGTAKVGRKFYGLEVLLDL